MSQEFLRSAYLLGEENIKLLNSKRVAIFGLGGVGSYTCEALARTGVGNFVLIDHDTICVTNLNRQIIATHDTIGHAKIEVMKNRILSINQNANVTIYKEFYLNESQNYMIEKCDYVIDAIDTVAAKIKLILSCKEHNVPIISAMGCGNKLDPTKLEVTDISKTSYCKLSRVMRHELKARGIYNTEVIYSKEPAITPISIPFACDNCKRCNNHINPTPHMRRATPGSVAWVPSVAGLIVAGHVVNNLLA